MNRIAACLATVLAWFLVAGVHGHAAGVPAALFESNGCIHATWLRGTSGSVDATFSFGLPAVPATRLWKEGRVLHGLWITNGIQYTETVFLSELKRNTGTNSTSIPLLFIEIHGCNTNSEYSEAFAEVSVVMNGAPLELEIKDGLLWRTEVGTPALLGRIEVPAPGVKLARGRVLRFSGNMPPAERGSLMLLVPLQRVAAETEIEQLRDVDFPFNLRNALKDDPEKGAVRSGSDKVARLEFASPRQAE